MAAIQTSFAAAVSTFCQVFECFRSTSSAHDGDLVKIHKKTRPNAHTNFVLHRGDKSFAVLHGSQRNICQTVDTSTATSGSRRHNSVEGIQTHSRIKQRRSGDKKQPLTTRIHHFLCDDDGAVALCVTVVFPHQRMNPSTSFASS